MTTTENTTTQWLEDNKNLLEQAAKDASLETNSDVLELFTHRPQLATAYIDHVYKHAEKAKAPSSVLSDLKQLIKVSQHNTKVFEKHPYVLKALRASLPPAGSFASEESRELFAAKIESQIAGAPDDASRAILTTLKDRLEVKQQLVRIRSTGSTGVIASPDFDVAACVVGAALFSWAGPWGAVAGCIVFGLLGRG